jgi:uncharacterized membrane protein YgdD (TMEM256/DUF423 family)
MQLGRFWIVIGALYGLLSLVAGTISAHYLPESMDAGARHTFDIAVRFQIFHALALLAAGLLEDRWKSRLVNLSGGMFAVGALLFCGSLYILALSAIGAFGAVAPVGGATLLLGWASLLLGALRHLRPQRERPPAAN